MGLQTNNTDLREILNEINNLPDAGGSAEQATPIISIDTSNGLITATAGTKTATKQLAFQAAQTIIPSTVNQTIAANTYLGGIQTIKGDANLVASNIKNGTSIFGVTGSYEGEINPEDKKDEDALIDKTIVTYTNDRVTKIGSYAFNECNSLKSINFPAVTYINSYAFYKCSSLTTINFPIVSYIGSYAFCSCSSLTNVNFPTVEDIGGGAFGNCVNLASISFPIATWIMGFAFQNCKKLINANFPEATTIQHSAFQYCYSLTNISFPKVINLGSDAFYGCSNLISADFPLVTKIDSRAFYGCNNLANINFPKVTDIGTNTFESCYKLTSIAFSALTNIRNSLFYNCSSLTSIYLFAPTVCKLSTSNAFSKTGIWSNKGSIFVPASLVASYKAATNWTYFSNRIFGV